MSSQLSQFSENRPEFDGINAFYFDNIYPHLLASERHRIQAVNKAKYYGAAAVLVGRFWCIQKLNPSNFLFLL